MGSESGKYVWCVYDTPCVIRPRGGIRTTPFSDPFGIRVTYEGSILMVLSLPARPARISSKNTLSMAWRRGSGRLKSCLSLSNDSVGLDGSRTRLY